jgi:hypothetical protein
VALQLFLDLDTETTAETLGSSEQEDLFHVVAQPGQGVAEVSHSPRKLPSMG